MSLNFSKTDKENKKICKTEVDDQPRVSGSTDVTNDDSDTDSERESEYPDSVGQNKEKYNNWQYNKFREGKEAKSKQLRRIS